MIDRTIQHYKITGRLGKGGMGEVYVAEDTKLDRRVALKILPAEMADDPVRLERFEREAKAIATLNHPNIVTIYSIEESEGIRFLTMELVEGDTLHHTIPSKGMDMESFLRLSIPIAEALSAAHEKSIIHRDLKPANIMVSNEGRVKILDFGLAKLLLHDSDPNASQLETRAKTADGIVMGTMPYMSPEQVQGRTLDSRTDIFSMGIIFYEMITGQRPFQGDTSADLISSILRDTPSPVGEIKGQVPEHLERILRRCLAKDPRDRYQTARDVYNELRDVQRGSGPVSQTTSTASRIAETELWIAVLPFRSPGSDPDAEMLADGLTEDITIGLSRFSYLKVIAHHSTSSYKDKAIDVRKVGRELNARYILEGAIRKSGAAVRINTQLLDTATGAHLWSDTYQADLSTTGIFDVQDTFAAKIASTIADTNGALTRSMAAVAKTKSIESMSPYDALLRGLAYWLLMTPEEHMEVRAWLERAVEQVPDYADAWATLARMYSEEYKQGFNPRPDSLDRALAAARRAIELDAASHLGYEALAEVSFFRKDFGTFRTAAERAITLNPLDGNTLAFMGILACYAGDWENGVATTDRAMALNPHRPGWYLFASFLDLYRQGEYERALEIAERVNMPSYYYSHMVIAAVNGQLGRNRAAQNAVRELLALVPDFPATIREELGDKWLSRNPDLFERLIEGLRKAGLEIPDTSGVSPRHTSAIETRPADSSADISAAQQAAPADSDAVRAQPHAMWIAVLPFQHPKDPEMEAFADGLSEDITGGLSQFSYLSVIARNSTQRFKGQSGGFTAVRDELGARFVLQGGIRKAGSLIRVNVQLIDTQKSTNLWAETYNRDLGTSDIFTVQDEITDRVVATVADNFGVLVRSMVTSLEGKPDDELTANEYVLRWFGYEGGRLAPKEHAKIRATLERAVERIPRNAEVWGCLAFVHFHEYIFKFNERSDSMDQTLVAAQRAVELNRASQIAYEALMWAYFIRGDVTAATSAAERAISLNPRNSHTLAVAGLVFVHTRSFERAVDITQRAIDLNPHHAGWFHFPIIWNYYVKGEYEQVLERAKRVNMPGFFWGPLAIASVCGELGRKAEATAAVNELLAINPDFATNARHYIEPWHKTSGFVEPLLKGLRKAGLDVFETSEAKPVTATAPPQTSQKRQESVSIAVLPFSDMSPTKDQDYLCEGMAEEIMNALVGIPGIRVAARNSAFRVKKEGRSLSEISRTLSVGHVLEGSVRIAGSRMRVMAQLTDVKTGYQLWSERYDREAQDVFALQDDIAAGVVEAVKTQLAPGVRTVEARSHVANLEAYHHYLMGRHLRYTKNDHGNAMRSFEEAVALDPSHPPSWLGLAEVKVLAAVYGLLPAREAYDTAKEALARATALQGESTESLYVEGMIAFVERDYEAAESLFTRATELRTDFVQARSWRGLLYAALGRTDESFGDLQFAREVDPLATYPYGMSALVHLLGGQPAEAIQYADQALDFDPENALALWVCGVALVAIGKHDSGIASLERALTPSNRGGFIHGVLGWALATSGRREEATAVLRELQARPELAPTIAQEACIHAALADNDAAFLVLEKAAKEQQGFEATLRLPCYDPLRTDPRFAQFLEQLGLPQAVTQFSVPHDSQPVAFPSPIKISDQKETQAGVDSDAVRAQPHAMWIAVLPFQHPKDPEMETFADGLSEDITAGLSQFSYLSVVAYHSTLRFKGQSGGVRAVRDELGARYVIQGGIRKSGTLIRVNVQLIDVQTGTNLWAETYNRDLQDCDIFATQDNITDRVVATVADGYGVLVRSMAAALEDKPEEELTAAEWVIRLYRYRQKLSPDEHAKLKESLERAVERNSKQADVWACLCQIYVDEYAGFGKDTQPDSLERALAAGRRALDIDRTSQLGCQLIAQTHFFMRNIAAFRPAAEWSISLNARDSNTHAILGLMIAHTRDFEPAVELVRRAMEINPGHAGWYHFGLIWYHFQKQEYEKALEHANKVNMPGMFWTYLATAAINGLLERQTEAAAAVKDLLRLDPDFAAKARTKIEAWHYASGLMDTILDGLKKAGLDIPEQQP